MPKISELPVNSSPSASATLAAVDNGETVQIPVLKLLGISIPILEPTSELTYTLDYRGAGYFWILDSISSNLSLETIVIPSSVYKGTDACPVREIKTATITGNSYIKKIYIPDSVTTIAASAFMGLSNCTIYCQAASKPDGWDDNWNSSGYDVVWGEVWKEPDETLSSIPYYDFTDTSNVTTIADFYNAVTEQGYVAGSNAFAKIGTVMYAFNISAVFGYNLQNVTFLDILALKRYFKSGADNTTSLLTMLSGDSSLSTITDVLALDVHGLKEHMFTDSLTSHYMSEIKDLIEGEGGDITKLNYVYLSGNQLLMKFTYVGGNYYVYALDVLSLKSYEYSIDIATTTIADFLAKESVASTSYVDTNFLPLSGGTMDGDINLGTNKGFTGTTASGNNFDIFRVLNSTRLQVGGTYPALEFKGKNTRPTYNGNDMALYSDCVPSCTTSDNGKFLRVVNGVAAWSTVPNAEEASF